MKTGISKIKEWLGMSSWGNNKKMIDGVSTDSRTIKKGELFIPLVGENFDGHDYIKSAFEKGAAAALAERGRGNPEFGPTIEVPDSLRALQEIARGWRNSFDPIVIGITGSTGKTSTKDILVGLLKGRKVVSTFGSKNNEIGVPLTLLEIDASTEVAVVEMGMRGIGQISALSDISSPSVGVITNIGPSHIELLGSVDNIFVGKSELTESLPDDGVAVLNVDDPYYEKIRKKCHSKVTTFGIGGVADLSAGSVNIGADGMDFEMRAEGRKVPVRTNLTGFHHVYNFLAAAATAVSIGVRIDDLATLCKGISLSENRGQLIATGNGVVIIDDCYNANPTSMKAAIDNLASLAREKHSIAVLGDMAELGDSSRKYHSGVGEHVACAGVEVLITIGDCSKEIARAARDKGVSLVKICHNIDQASVEINEIAKPGSIVLVKASRFMKLERLVDRLKEMWNEPI